MNLVKEIRSLHRNACEENATKRAKSESHENALWMKEQRRLARPIIAELPDKLRKAAASGQYSVTIFRWTDTRQGFWDNMKGVPAILQSWCKRQGIKVSHSVGREGFNPECGELTVFMHNL